IRKSIVVVVSDRDSHSIKLDIEPRGARNIRERSVAIVPVELQCGPLLFVPRPIHPVDQKNVLPAVAVIIQKRAPGAKRLRQQFSWVGTVVVWKIDSGL